MQSECVEKLRRIFQEDLKEYRSIPFWSWNSGVEETELLKQIEEMKEAGLGGFIIHARLGLNIEYLGEHWFSCVEACLNQARKLGMQVWIYDDNGFPSGSAGGKLLETEQFRARFLTYEVRKEYDKAALCVFRKTPEGFRRIYRTQPEVTEYHTIMLNVSPSDTDILNPEVVEDFIQETHEQYYIRFSNYFGKELMGFFTDEPQYYRYETPYSSLASDLYRERYQEEMEDGLIWLFHHDERGYVFRQRYYAILNELYTSSYYQRLYQWCEEHGCMLTGHSVEETQLYTQMWGGGACMPTYEYEHIPGVDCLNRECGSELAPKQVSSAAAQLGKEFVLTETFGCAGYDVTPIELRSLAEYQYFNGVNLMCQHLIPYSLAGQGKQDYPPIFSPQNNWWKEFRSFNDYFTRLGYVVANTKETCDVLILHPMRGIWLDYIRSEDGVSVEKMEEAFQKLLIQFRKKGIRYQFADEEILKRHGKAKGEILWIGQCRYNTIVIPDMKTLSASTVEILHNYTGRICFLGSISYINGRKTQEEFRSNLTLEEILGQGEIPFSCEDGLSGMTTREGEIGSYLFVKNYSRTEESTVVISGLSKQYRQLHLDTLTISTPSDELKVEPCGSRIFIKDHTVTGKEQREIGEDITSSFDVTDMTENTLVMDYAALSMDGKIYGKEQPLPQIFEELLRKEYCGDIYIRQRFVVNERMALRLRMEKENLFFCQVNGQDVRLEQSPFDVNFVEGDISQAVQEGENRLEYGIHYYQHETVTFDLFDPAATDSARTRLYYDTYLENTYLMGEFLVGDNHVLSKRNEYPPVCTDYYQRGYPFFCGTVTMSGSYSYDGKGRRALTLAGSYQVVEAYINEIGISFVCTQSVDITDYLQEGINSICLMVKSSLRNLFGPHHLAEETEPMGVWPKMFTLRGDWKDGMASFYTHEYHCVPFGISEIRMDTIVSN